MIYLLEDDASIRKLVIYALESQGYEAKGFGAPSLFWKAMERELPELVLLDIMLPEEDGMAVLSKIRSSAATKKLPVIMLTAKNTEYDRVIGLDTGADDFVSKPFGMMELMARIRAVLRRAENRQEITEYQVGSLYVCPEKHIVRNDSGEISLTHKEFELLCLLLENKGVVLTRDVLMDKIWGCELDRENRTLDVHIRTLRSKLGDSARYIETVRGLGYKFDADK